LLHFLVIEPFFVVVALTALSGQRYKSLVFGLKLPA